MHRFWGLSLGFRGFRVLKGVLGFRVLGKRPKTSRREVMGFRIPRKVPCLSASSINPIHASP